MQDHKPGQKPTLSSTILVLSLVLAAQAGAYQLFTKAEKVAQARPLIEFPEALGTWVKTQEGIIDKETLDVLKADDTLNRSYESREVGMGANLFVASFRSQRAGAAPHSPKNCLPGSGWTPIINDRVLIQMPGRAEPFEVNRYIVQRGNNKSLVLYWYQSRDRTVASEYKAKLYTMLDAIKDNRTDTALVRVVIGLGGEESNEKALQAAENFVRSFYGPLRQFLPA